jgi:TolB-like protein
VNQLIKNLIMTTLVVFFSTLPLAADVKGEIRKAALEISKAYKDKNADLLLAKNLAILNLSASSQKLKAAGIGETVASLLANTLSQSTIFRLVEREGMSKIMKEQALASSGLVSEENAVKTGNLLGAELLLDGSVGEVGEEVVINLRLTDVEKGTVVLSKSFNLPREEVIKEADTFIASTFQSESGISFALSAQYGFSLDKPNYFIGIVGPEASYKFTKNFALGVAFLEIFGAPPSSAVTKVPAVTYYKFAPNGLDSEFHSPTFFATGGKLFADIIVPVGTRVNLSFRLAATIYPDPKMTYDVYELPTGELTYDPNLALPSAPLKPDVAYRSIKVTGYGFKPLYAFDGEVNLDFLISKRLSLLVGVGYEFSPTWTPTAFDAKGNVQDSVQTHDGKKTDDASLANYNGTFQEFFGVNFATDRNGKVYGFGGSLITAQIALALHF